jgi:hypothetical protein
MKTRIVSTRIPAAQANGAFNISLPTGFGVPKGFLVYAMDNGVQPNNFDSNTDFPCICLGFGGNNISGTGISNAHVYLLQEEGTDPTVCRSGFGGTVSVFTSNTTGTVRRQWQMTSFGNDLILGTYQGTGTQQTPLDLVFTIFGGNDFSCAIGLTQLAVTPTQTRVQTTFQPDAVLFSTLRNISTDSTINFCSALRNAAAGSTRCGTVLDTFGPHWRNDNGQGSTSIRSFMSNNGARNLSSNTTIYAEYMSPTEIIFSQSTANTHFIIFLAMKAGTGLSTNPSFAHGQFQSATGIGNSFYSVGFKPAHILGGFLSSDSNASRTNVNNLCETLSFYTANGHQKSNIVGIGTFTSSTSSTTITGVGTSFLQQFGAIDNIYNLDYQLVGIVSSITSNTSLLLQSNAAITATGSSFIFEKPQQFSYTIGCQTGDGNGNANIRGYISDNAIVNFSPNTPQLRNVGNITNLNGQNGFNVNYTTVEATFGNRIGWYFAIKDDDFYRRRRGSIS